MSSNALTRRSEAGALPPEHGARFVLELVSGEIGRARYALLVEHGGAHTSHATLDATGATLEAWQPALEPWATEQMLGFCRTVAKNHAERGDWPAVLRRWRSPR